MATPTRPRTGNGQNGPVVVRRRPRRPATANDVEAAAADGVAWLRSQVQTHPWPAVGGAAVAGWVLGGGLTPRILIMVLASAGRVATARILAAGLESVVHGDATAEATATAEG